MKSFDYARAWREVARPAYENLPPVVHRLLERTADLAGDLHQLSDCSMPWPDVAEGYAPLQADFCAIDADTLALAAHVINAVGHWYPGLPACICGHSVGQHKGGKCNVWSCEAQCNQYQPSVPQLSIPGREAGAHWKFSHYADQDLRERLGLPARGLNGRERGIGYAVHEGVIRVTYASRTGWTWTEIAPATEEGMQHAKAFARKVAAAGAGIDRRRTREIEHRKWQVFDNYRKANHLEAWPEGAWRAFARITDIYQTEEA